MIRTSRRITVFVLLTLMTLAVRPLGAATIKIDYSTDTNNFFPVGSQARATVEAVATFYSNILNDSLSAIQTPSKFIGQNGTVEWHWTRSFNHPTSGVTTFHVDPTVPANEFTIYVGAKHLTGNALGLGGPGGHEWSRKNTGSFNPTEEANWMNIHNQFVSAVEMRGQSSGFGRWGGFFTVDTTLSPGWSWHLNHTTPPTANTIDLFSVALHEIGHALGIGNISTGTNPPSVWQTLLNGATTHFIGSQAVAVHGSPVPLHSDDAHFAEGTASKNFTTFANQEVAFDPTLTVGTRKHLTLLDAAALIDLGWEINLPSGPPVLAGDYNGDGKVDAADYTVWRNNLGDSTEADINFAGSGGGVTATDYTYWKTRYGNMAPGGGGLAGFGTVPEPGSMVLILMAAGIASLHRPRSASRRG